MKKSYLALGAVVAAAAMPAPAVASPTPAPNASAPNNMGYCAPLLAKLGVRPMINHLLATNGEAFGYANPGDMSSDRARSRTDRACLPR